jgi:hypothetical protein
VKLANEHIVIELGGEFITLRPTLRCGFRLERREGSFAKLISDLQEGSLTAAHFVLADNFHRPTIATCIVDAGLEDVCGKLILHAISCTGLDPNAKPDPNAEPSNVTFGDHLTQLYRIATGWLGWTPDVALDSTPAEITEAYKGRLDMLKAVFGGDDTPKGNPAEKLKAMFADKGAVKGKRRK